MPIVDVTNSDPFVDGRQSERALQIRIGVERYFRRMNWAYLPELTLKSGRRADVIAVSPKGEIAIVEIKSSIADLKADNKWHEYHDFCDELLFATLPDVPADIFPTDAGLIIADQHGAELMRPAIEKKLSAPRRKSVNLTFARAAAHRLARLCSHADVDSAQLLAD